MYCLALFIDSLLKIYICLFLKQFLNLKIERFVIKEYIFSICGCIVLTTCCVIFDNSVVNYLICFGFSLIYFCLIMKEQFLDGIKHATTAYLMMAGIDIIAIIVTGLLNNWMLTIQMTFDDMFIHSLLCKIVIFILCYFIFYVKKILSTNNSVWNKNQIIRILVCLFSVLLILFIYETSIHVDIVRNINYTVMIFAIVVLLGIMLFLLSFMLSQRQKMIETESEAVKKNQSDIKEYYDSLVENYENQGLLIHDFKKHLCTIDSLFGNHEYDKAANYVKSLINNEYINKKMVFCRNDILNVVLSRYSHRLKMKKVDFHVDIRANTLNNISDEDITVIFGNILDNAEEAAALCEKSFIELSIFNRNDGKLSIISIINSCQSNPINKRGVLVKRKKDITGLHGIGLKSVEKTIRKYRGDMQRYYDNEDNTFHLLITLENSKND